MCRLVTATFDASVLEWEQRVSDAVEQDSEIVGYVRQLEEEADRAEASDLPSGDDLAAEFQNFCANNATNSSGPQIKVFAC